MRKTLVPEFWLTSKINGESLRTVIAVAMYANKEGCSFVQNSTLTEYLGKEARQIQIDLEKGIKAGLISRHFDDRGKRFFVVHRDIRTGASTMRPTYSECATPRNDNAPPGALPMRPPAHSECAPPNNPLIGVNLLLQSTSSTNTQQPHAPNTECVSVSGETSLPLPQPKTEIPEDLKRMASQLGLESWIGELSFQGESLQDWRVRETLGVIYAQGGKKGSRYAWGIFRNLPKEQPASGYTSIASKEQQEAERIARNLARLDALR